MPGVGPSEVRYRQLDLLVSVASRVGKISPSIALSTTNAALYFYALFPACIMVSESIDDYQRRILRQYTTTHEEVIILKAEYFTSPRDVAENEQTLPTETQIQSE